VIGVPGRHALILDCDGVLADTERYGHLVAFNQTFAEFGLPVRWSVDEYRQKVLIGGGKERLAGLLTPEFVAAAGLPPDAAGQRDTVDSTYTIGRRGVAGNFFVIKAVGAAAEQGADLDDLLRIGNKVNSVTRTMGMALTSCTPPAKGSPLFELGEDEMEMGVGIHGEPGRKREKLASANAIVDELLEAVVSDLPFKPGDDVALMINGLGGTPISELYLLYGYAHEQLAKRGIHIQRNYVGEYCTSLDMAGASITLSRLDDEISGLLGAPAEIAIRTF
jgi:dihydroxyacetone kinase